MPVRRAAILRATIAAFAWSLASTSAAGAQLSIDRGELQLAAEGTLQERAGTLTVRNAGSSRSQGVVVLEDWDRSFEGANRFHALGTMPHSCSEYLRVFPLAINLAPGESQVVRIEYTGPVRSAECTTLVVVQDVQAPQQNKGALSFAVRLGLKVYVTPTTTVAGGDIADMVVVPAATDRANASLAVTYHNNGTRRVIASGKLEIRREDNTLVETVALPDAYALAGARMRVVAPLPRLERGRYVLLAMYDFGGSELAAAQLEYEAR